MSGKLGKLTGSMKFRMLLPVILLTLAIATALTLCASRIYTQTILEKEDAKVQSSFLVAGNAIRKILESSQQTAADLLLNDKIKTYAVGNFASIRERVNARMMCKDVLADALLRQPYLHGVLYMRADGSVFGDLLKRTYFFDENTPSVFDEQLQTAIQQASEKNMWLGPIDGRALYQIHIFDWKIPNDLLFGVRRMNIIGYGPIYAIAVVDTAKLMEYLELLTDGNSHVYLIKPDGSVIAQAGTDTALAAETWERISDGREQGSKRIRIAETGEYLYMSYQQLNESGWYLVRGLPMEEYDRSVAALRTTVIQFSVIALLIALAIYIRWLRGFLATFDWLKNGIITIRKGKLGAQMEPPININEFEIIRQEFNHMSASLARQVEATLEMEHQQLELQLRNLQTQLSPHMIFNSLTAMRWMASMAGADQVAAMLLELSEMLRPVFRDWKNEWTIGEEIDHLRHYISLLQLRYGSQFTIDYDVEDKLFSMLIPRFTIQPLIENACEHGGVKMLHVSVRAWYENDQINIVVSDNGRGITPERLLKIREGIESGDMGGSIGLVNVSSRLRILSMGHSSMKVECPSKGGTIISLCWKNKSKS